MTVDGNQTSGIGGGWGRIAIVFGTVLSIAWIGAMLVRGSEQMRVQRLSIADDAQKSCQERREKDCSGVWMRAYFETERRQRDTPDLLKPGVLEGLVPVLVGWLIAYGVVSSVRWIRDGFKLDRRSASNPGDSDDARSGGGLSEGPGGPVVARIIKNLHIAAVTLLVASGGFMVASVVAHHTAGFESWADGLGATYLRNFALAVALYALLAVLLIGQGIVRLIASPTHRH